jgi:periplasmic protein TonB
MATSIDHLSGLGPGLRIGPRLGAFPAQKKKQLPASRSLQAIEEGGLFHESLIVSGGKVRPRNLWAAAGSITLQSMLLLAVVVIPLFHTEILPKRETLTSLYLQPPAAAPIGTRVRTPTPKSAYIPTSTGISAPVNKTQEAPPTPDGTVGGVVGGVPGGVIGGIPGGALSGVLGSTRSVPVLAKTPAPAPITRIRLAQRIVEANLIHDVTPTYPPEAGRARVEGTVVLLAVIGKDGTVQDVHVESGLPILAQAAMDAVKQWRYRPYLLNGEPVEVDSRITINFALSRG